MLHTNTNPALSKKPNQAQLNQEFNFAPELGERPEASAQKWKILVVDDEEDVHHVTKLALGDNHVHGRNIRCLHAYSGSEAVEIMEQEDDIAVILMDVVMESGQAGLDAVNRIRNELKNEQVRIVLRTGQPSDIPASQVVQQYDINDYRDKTELTRDRLFSVVYTGLSMYQDIVQRQERQKYLEDVIHISNTIFRRRLPSALCHGMLVEAARLLRHKAALRGCEEAEAAVSGLAAPLVAGAVSPVVAGIGSLAGTTHGTLQDALGHFSDQLFPEPGPQAQWKMKGGELYGTLNPENGSPVVFYLRGPALAVADKEAIDIFLQNATLALGATFANQQLEASQKEMLTMLGGAIEQRSKETGNHVRRVGEMSRHLGLLSGMSEDEANRLGIAAPLHDAGKISIPDAILNKPGKHTDEERKIMQQHAVFGARMFERSDLPALTAAAIVAHQHHERWDGKGYPQGLQGTAIHPFGRIVALTDVFDALCSKRCYKSAWSESDALDLIKNQAGTQFDPELVALFEAHYEEFLEIRSAYPDEL